MAKVTLNLRIDEELKKRLTAKLKTTGETATDVVVKAIEAYCNDEPLPTAPSNASNDAVTQGEEIAELKKQIEALQRDAVTIDHLYGLSCLLRYCNDDVTIEEQIEALHCNDNVTIKDEPK